MSSTVTTPSTTQPAGTAAAQQASQSQQQLNADKTEFLTLLTAQLKNQDPLSPMDSTQFTNQLVQYSAVEQQININSNLATLISLTQESITANALNYVGKAVQATGTTAPLQNGQLNASYTLASDSQNTTIAIEDSAGNVVYSATGSTKAGTYPIQWNGQTNGGVQEPDGAYTVTVTAVGANNTTVNVSQTVYGTVTAVTEDPTTNQPDLSLGSVTVPLSSVLGIG